MDAKMENVERQLELAEEKKKLLAMTTQIIHRTTCWQNDFLRNAVQKLNYLVERIEKTHVVGIEDLQLAQARSCIEDFHEKGDAKLAPWSRAALTLQAVFPALGIRIFHRTDDSTIATQNYAKATKIPGAKLRDPRDAEVTLNGEILGLDEASHFPKMDEASQHLP